MERDELEAALTVARKILADAISSSSYGGESKKNGQEAKNAAIRSSGPIQKLHLAIAKSVYEELLTQKLNPSIFPPLGATSPELKVTGLLKAKDQDIAFTVKPHIPEKIMTGVEAGSTDPIGYEATNSALVIGVRSQLSSLAKNFDTLVERAFAETLNLRLRCPNITLGEVYLIPLNEFDDFSLKSNIVGFKNTKVDLLKFVRIFNAITDPNYQSTPSDLYKYNSTMLIVADFSKPKVSVLWDYSDVKSEFDTLTAEAMRNLVPAGFQKRISASYLDAINNQTA
jgi:hypothetical protein